LQRRGGGDIICCVAVDVAVTVGCIARSWQHADDARNSTTVAGLLSSGVRAALGNGVCLRQLVAGTFGGVAICFGLRRFVVVVVFGV
jgi:hypothetical protein